MVNSRGRSAVVERRAARRRVVSRVDVGRLVVLVRVAGSGSRRSRSSRSVSSSVSVVRVVRNVGGSSRRTSSSSVRRTVRSRVRVVLTLGELGAGSSRGKEVIVVASYTTLDLLVVGVSHTEEVRVDRDASGATVSRRRASREVFGVRVRSASALGFPIDGDDTDRSLLRVVAIILVDDDRVDDGGRAVRAGA